MNVSIFGSGYVGLVTGACLADVGNSVLCVDIDPERVAQLNAGEVPVREPGLDEMVARNLKKGRLRFTTDGASAVAHGQFLVIAVGTPSTAEGAADLRQVESVVELIERAVTEYKVIMTKSTSPVGTTDRIAQRLKANLSARARPIEVDVVSNPEFLKQGSAVSDFMSPDRVVLGTTSARAVELARALFDPFTRNHERMLVMDAKSAELTKYAANVMLATRISLMNELANVAEFVGADIESVRQGIGSDPRIGYSFIYPGIGYGGSCFPKDLRALMQTAREHGYEPALLQAVESVNMRQKAMLFDKISAYFAGALRGRTVALWGLAFKPKTDDLREAPSRDLLAQLWAAGVNVRAYDPVAMPETHRLYGERSDLTLCLDAESALHGADVLAICTEWAEFRSPSFQAMRELLQEKAVFDGRNLYDPELMTRNELLYFPVGRSQSKVLRPEVLLPEVLRPEVQR